MAGVGIVGRLVMEAVHDRVAEPAPDEPPIDRERRDPGDGERNRKDSPLSRPASMAPGTATSTALSTVSITVIEIVSAANAMPAAARNARPD